MVTRVINIRSKEPNDVYIGNIVRYHPDKYPQTIWGNPWAKELRKYGRDKVVAMYREYILANNSCSRQ